MAGLSVQLTAVRKQISASTNQFIFFIIFIFI